MVVKSDYRIASITPAPPDRRLRWKVWVLGSSNQDPAAGELIR